MKTEHLQELYVDQLRDLLDAEKQIIKALPKMIRAASSEDLKNALNEHLEITKQQEQRIEQIFEGRGEKPKAQKCKGIEGVLKEGSELVEKDWSESVRNAAIIAAAQRVEHYEMAAYGTARTFAQVLDDSQASDLLQRTLDEEKQADQKLTELAQSINAEANEESEGAEVTGEGKKATSAARSRKVA